MKKFILICATFFLIMPFYTYGQEQLMVVIQGEDDKPIVKEEKVSEAKQKVIIKRADPKKTKKMLKELMDEKMLDVENQLMKQRIDDVERKSNIIDVILGALMLFILISLGVLIRKKK